MAATRRNFRATTVVVALLAGAVAQLGERLVRNEEVRGSNPLGSTSPAAIPQSSIVSVRARGRRARRYVLQSDLIPHRTAGMRIIRVVCRGDKRFPQHFCGGGI